MLRGRTGKKNKETQKREQATEFLLKIQLPPSQQNLIQAQSRFENTDISLSESYEKIQLQNLAAYLYTKTKKFNVHERIRSSNYVIKQIKQELIDQIDLFVCAAQSYLLFYDIPYDKLLTMVETSSQDPVVLTQMKLEHSETLALCGLGKAHFWYLVFTQILTELKGKKDAKEIKASLENKIIRLISQDLLRATYFFILRFFSKDLKSDYYLCYELLLEKCIWVLKIGARLEQILLADLENATQNLSAGQNAIKDLFTLLLTYQYVVKFLYFFGEDFTTLIKQASSLCDKLLLMKSKIDSLKTGMPAVSKITEYQSYFENLLINLPKGKLPCVTTFNLVKYFYIEEWQTNIFASKDISLIEFNHIVDKIILAVKNQEDSDLERMMMITQIIAVLGQYKSMPSQTHSDLAPRILELLHSTLLYVDFKNNTEKCVVHTTQAILKQIAQNIIKDSKLAVFLDLKNEIPSSQEEDIIITDLLSLKIKAYKEKYQTNDQEYEQAMRSFEIEGKEQLKNYKKECDTWANKVNQQEEKNQKEIAALKKSYQVKFNAIIKQIESHKENYLKKKEEAKEKPLLEKELQKELATLQKNHEALCEALKKTHLEEEQTIILSHQKIKEELKEKNSQEIKKKQIEYQNMIINQEKSNRQKEIQLKKHLEKVKKRAFEGMENFYQKKVLRNNQTHHNTLEKTQQQILQEEKNLDILFLAKLVHVATIYIPEEIEHFFQEFEDHGITYCIFGGYVRDNMLGIAYNDIDVRVNCLPEQLLELPTIKKLAKATAQPDVFKLELPTIKKFVKPTAQPDIFKLVSLDLVCKPWQWKNLSTVLETFDFKINTFICYKGKVYDLLGYHKSLFYPEPNPYLELIRPAHECFKEMPALILRLIRLSRKLNKAILPSDYGAILELGGLISQLPIGVYISNLKKLFVNDAAPVDYQNIRSLQLLAIVIPTLPENYEAHLSSDLLATLEPFWLHKMHEVATKPVKFNGYYVLALFLLMPFLLNNNNLNCVIDNFLDRFKGLNHVDQEMLRCKIGNLIYGIYDEYKYFDLTLRLQAFDSQKNDDDIFAFNTNYYLPAFASRQSQGNSNGYSVLKSVNNPNGQRFNNFF